MKRTFRTSTLSVGFFLFATLGTLAAILTDGSKSHANNPPDTLLGTVAVDPSDDPAAATPTPVWAIAEGNGRYYIGGNFAEIGGEPQPYLAAIEVATGRLDPTFRPQISGLATEVTALALSSNGDDLYIGGRFSQVDGAFRNRIAKLDARTGSVDPAFNPNASGVIDTIAVDDTGVYVGGAFVTIGGGTSPQLAKLNLTTGMLDPTWTAVVDGNVLDIELLSGTNVFVGGNFLTVNGASHPYLVQLDTTTGAVAAGWATSLPVPQKVLAISVRPDQSMVFVGVAGTAGELGNTVWAYSASGTRLWQRPGAGDVQALEATEDVVYAGTHGKWIFLEPKFLLDGVTPNPAFPIDGYVESSGNANAVERGKFYSMDADTGDLLPWNPNADSLNGVWELETGPSGLLAGGDFMTIENPNGVDGTPIFSPHVAIFPMLGGQLDAAPEPHFTTDCAGTACTFDASGSFDDVGITNFGWDFGDGQTATGPVASVLLADNATHDVSLTLTDTSNQTTIRSEKVLVGTGGLPVQHVGSNTTNSNSTSISVAPPASAAPYDVAVVFLALNDATVSITGPEGWTLAGDSVDSNLRSMVWTRVLDQTDLGAGATFTSSLPTKANLSMSVFRGLDPTSPVQQIDSQAETLNRVGHRAPSLALNSAVVVHNWAQRSTGNTEFTAPGVEVMLTDGFGVGPSAISSITSLVPAVATSVAPDSVATAEHHSQTAIGWTLALEPYVRPTCDGLTVTVDLALGESPTNGADVIQGTSGDDVITAMDGDDIVCGGSGADTINGGPGIDRLFGEEGDDAIFGLDGDDFIDGGAGMDELIGFGGNDTIDGGLDDDIINGGPGDDVLFGGDGDDEIFGQGGADTIDAGPGDDFAVGFTENDLIQGGPGLDVLNGGPGQDQVFGGLDDDIVFGLSGDDDVRGEEGNDRVFGQLGVDVVRGGPGDDDLFGNEGNDTLLEESGSNVMNGGLGDDTITGGDGPDDIFGDGSLAQAGNDTLDGGSGGPDLILGFAGDDSIDSANGISDIVNGGPGTDPCLVDVGVDTVFNCE